MMPMPLVRSPRSQGSAADVQHFKFPSTEDDIGDSAAEFAAPRKAMPLRARPANPPTSTIVPSFAFTPPKVQSDGQVVGAQPSVGGPGLLPDIPRDPSADMTPLQVPWVNAPAGSSTSGSPDRSGTWSPMPASLPSSTRRTAQSPQGNYPSPPMKLGAALAANGSIGRTITLHYSQGEMPAADLTSLTGGQGSPVVVKMVAPGGKAAKAGVQPGATIHSITGAPNFMQFPGWQVQAMMRPPVAVELHMETKATFAMSPASPRCKEIRLTRKSEQTLGIAPRAGAWNSKDVVMLAEEVVFKPSSAPLWLSTGFDGSFSEGGGRSPSPGSKRPTSPTVYELRRPEAHRLVQHAARNALDKVENIPSFQHRGARQRSNSPFCGLEECLPDWASDALMPEPANEKVGSWKWQSGAEPSTSSSLKSPREVVPLPQTRGPLTLPAGLQAPANDVIGQGRSPRKTEEQSSENGKGSLNWSSLQKESMQQQMSQPNSQPSPLQRATLMDRDSRGRALERQPSPLRWFSPALAPLLDSDARSGGYRVESPRGGRSTSPKPTRASGDTHDVMDGELAAEANRFIALAPRSTSRGSTMSSYGGVLQQNL